MAQIRLSVRSTAAESGLSEAEALAKLGPGGVVLVVGASGVGKDTILAGAAAALRNDEAIVFVRRSITRPPHASEPFDDMTPEEFARARGSGAFTMTWEAHGLSYGIPISAEREIAAGRTIVVNASRSIIPQARGRFERLCVVLIECETAIRAERMAARRRESASEIAARLSRTVEDFAPCASDVVIDNSGAPEIATAKLCALLREFKARPQA